MDNDIKVVDVKNQNVTHALLMIGGILFGSYFLFNENIGRAARVSQERSLPAHAAQYNPQNGVPELPQHGLYEELPSEPSFESETTDSPAIDETQGVNSASKNELGLMIENSLIFNEKTQKSLIDGSKVVEALVTEGFIASQPTSSHEYNNYYLVNGEIEVLGSKLIAFKHKYFKERTKCCANMGSAVLLSIKDNSYVIERFAEVNKCKLLKGNFISLPDEMSQSINNNNLDMSSLVLLTCEEHYRNEIDNNSITISPDLLNKDFKLPNEVDPIKTDIKTLPENPRQNQKNCTQAVVALNQCN